MAKKTLNKRQAWRIKKVQDEKANRLDKRQEKLSASSNQLGPEQTGLIISRFGQQVDVEVLEGEDTGKIQRCFTRSNLPSLVAGDKVAWQASPDSNPGVVVAMLPRSSVLTRPAPHGPDKTIAANIDQLFIVIAPEPTPSTILIDRYFIAAESAGVTPLLILNKSDLLTDGAHQDILDMVALYKAIGYDTLTTNCTGAEGLKTIIEQLGNKTSVFVGQSGVGKSSLINTLLPDANIAVNIISDNSKLGQHTTTTARLFHFPTGGDLIDSPGIRDFGLSSVSLLTLQQGFIELEPFFGLCKFRNCSHEREPGCALQKAAEDGEISQARLDNFLRIKTETNAEH